MDEETAIINSNTRNEKIKNFFIDNKKIIISTILLILILLSSYFLLKDYKYKKKIEVSELYNSILIQHSEINKTKTVDGLTNLIYEEDSTYSPLALYFIIDNLLIEDQNKVNELFDVVIDNGSLDKEIKNLIQFKKALYNSDNIDENQLLNMLKPLINSESIWKSHALYLMAEFFYSKNEKQKSKEFYTQIILLENGNQNLKIEAQKRLNRDLSE
jgi:predicted negative regulator of RcsB-dependent stress response